MLILYKYALQTMYYTMIYPYFYYCNIVCASTYPSRLAKITVPQKRIIRIIFGCKYRDYTSNYFKELHIFKFSDINILQTSLFTQYCTRSSDNYYLKSVNTDIKQFSIKCKSSNVWNSIPVTIWSLNNIKKFKHQI